jgi:hypothetical protein
MKGDEVGAWGTGQGREVQGGRKAPAAYRRERDDSGVTGPGRIKNVTDGLMKHRMGRWHRLSADCQHIIVPVVSQGLMNERNTNQPNASRINSRTFTEPKDS